VTADAGLASIVIPAHNEAAVLGNVLTTLLAGAQPGELDVVVVANGCNDRTAEIAGGYGPDVRVIETDVPSKPNALNLGDEQARGFPRIYLDADIPIGVETIRRLVHRLAEPGALAASPSMRVDTAGRPWAIRAYYDIWTRLPYVADGQLAGVIALSEAGRARFGRFEDLIADDLYVRGHFAPEERLRLDDCEYVVQAPRNLRSLVNVKVRSFAGTIELQNRFPEVERRARGRGGVRGRMRTLAREPRLWPALACYVGVWATARAAGWWTIRFRKSTPWRRDETTR
jgi:glycosyltransferase involved in cell wall biosynthesis